ncbi:MAG: 50S ribosomal protein L23 [bacterium]|nr:50S ribosomal protein L23 [bacterium]
MALLDFLKNKKEKEKAKEAKVQKPSAAKEAKEVKAPKAVAKEVKPAKATVKTSPFSYSIIKEPHISEKATYLAEDDKYVFRVHGEANKPEIKKSVEGIYGVDVVAVNMIRIPKKKRRLGKTEGYKKGFSKAVVTIKKGQKIEIF